MPASAVGSLEIPALAAGYRDGAFTPVDVIDAVYDRIEAYGDEATFISLLFRHEAKALARDLGEYDSSRPLWGIPCAIKDNIDAEGFATTLACPEAAYTPTADAPVVAGLKAAGALVLGKTNLDQFATGLNGTRSPFGTPRNAISADLIPGGSSSGSGVAVAAGLVSFALGTDTAGSGRVPAAMGSIVGLKPSRGLVSARGVYPACASLDCASVFALTVDDAAVVASCISGEDPEDPYSRALPAIAAAVAATSLEGRRLGIPADVEGEWWGDKPLADAWEAVISALTDAGVTLVPIPMEEFFEAGSLLYGGAWLAERYASIKSHLADKASAMDPTVRQIVARGEAVDGAEVFASLSRLELLRRAARRSLANVDALLTPTVAGVCSPEQMRAEPISLNQRLGRFTTFTNLLDLAAVAVPASVRDGVPFGVSVQAPAGSDNTLIALAAALADVLVAPLGATGWTAVRRERLKPPGATQIAVVGAHLRDQPLHGELLDAGAVFNRADRTAAAYRLFALPTAIPKPGLIPAPEGAPVDVEVYDIAHEGLGRLLERIPAPLALGRISLFSGESCLGFVCTDVSGASDITSFGGWRAYLASSQAR